MSHYFLDVRPFNCPAEIDEASYYYTQYMYRSGAVSILSCPTGDEKKFETAFQTFNNPVYFIGIDEGDLCFKNL